MSPRDVLELGQAIVAELELDARGNVLERWLSHHLAELMLAAEAATGAQKEEAERQAVEVILQLWVHRRALPSPVDPIGGYRDAIAVLGRLMPEADPWRRYRHDDSYEGLLSEMFETLCRIVVSGLLLTHLRPIRAPSRIESEALEEEETYLSNELKKWLKLVMPASNGGIDFDSDPADNSANESDAKIEGDSPTPVQEAAEIEAEAYSAIAIHLERMQEDLTKLLKRWRAAAPKSLEVAEGQERVAEDDT